MTARQPSASTQFSTFMSRFPDEIVALVKRCMPKLRRELPGANQIVYDYNHSVVVSFSMSERGYEAIVAMAVLSGEVKLYFDKSLPDPKGLLMGTGSKVRSVTVKAASDLDRGDIYELLKAAIKHSGVSFPRTSATRAGRMIIQSQSKKASKKKDPKKPRTRKAAKA